MGKSYKACRFRGETLMPFSSALHLGLLAIRCLGVLKSKRVSELSRLRWNLPTGQLQFEVSLKFMREPERPSLSEEQGA